MGWNSLFFTRPALQAGLLFSKSAFSYENANNNSCSPNHGLEFVGRIKSKDVNDIANTNTRGNFQGFKKGLVKALYFVFKPEI